ncbi:glycosyltransferase family 4 protein [Acidiphilium sp. AL]|uniref:Glycosyltransferase family 4 protein n=1 Tax=Acidiphilium iwatense TaxID=768198 RepID=A0ABS9DYE5_9PROT|nr:MULTISPECIES: glycosyltransferase family 4 protein [Acidiphilium]MCF3947779.1 glycosyltransferase family 4 protein [Acidiphilium iwatense]MCU4161564.1 glycosyltransferase family 4 protein [Acidiphilium sp. AL]
MVLPAREGFGPERAGAIAMVVRRLALASHARVIGGAQADATYQDIIFEAVSGRSPLIYGLGVIRRLRVLSPTIIEVHQQPRLARAIAWALPNARVLLFLHNEPLTMRGLRNVAARRRTLASLHRVVCVSEHLRASFASGLSETSNLVVLPNPLTLAELPPRAAIRSPEILFAGRIVENKGIADFIAACAATLPSLCGWSARIIGGDRFGSGSPETPYVGAMRKAARDAGIRFEGYRPHAAVLAAMAEVAIVVVPSRWPEPFGLTALEAMASGAALIVSRTGGLLEVAGEAARYVPPGDVAALAAAIGDLATHDAARAALASAGIARAAQFDTAIIKARLQALRGVESSV